MPVLPGRPVERGVITTVQPHAMFTVRLNDDQDVNAALSGRMRSRYTRLGAGDKVLVELSSSDRTRGRIVDRDRGEGDGDPGAPQRVLV